MKNSEVINQIFAFSKIINAEGNLWFWCATQPPPTGKWSVLIQEPGGGTAQGRLGIHLLQIVLHISLAMSFSNRIKCVPLGA